MHRREVAQLVRRLIPAAHADPVKPQDGELTVRGLATRLNVPDRVLLRWMQEDAPWMLPPDRIVQVGGGNYIRFWQKETATRIAARKAGHDKAPRDLRPPGALTAEELAAHYGVRLTIIRWWLRTGKLPPADGKGRGADGSRRQSYWLPDRLPRIVP